MGIVCHGLVLRLQEQPASVPVPLLRTKDLWEAAIQNKKMTGTAGVYIVFVGEPLTNQLPLNC